jgi:hypothetical protein
VTRNMAESRTAATTSSEGEGTLEDACKVTKGCNLHLRKFRSRIHVATKEVPKSKSVAVHVPAKTGTKCNQENIFVNDGESQWIDFVETSACLGSYVHADLSDEEEARARMSNALNMFGCLRRHLLSPKGV